MLKTDLPQEEAGKPTEGTKPARPSPGKKRSRQMATSTDERQPSRPEARSISSDRPEKPAAPAHASDERAKPKPAPAPLYSDWAQI
jgi:hypothetical protein